MAVIYMQTTKKCIFVFISLLFATLVSCGTSERTVTSDPPTPTAEGTNMPEKRPTFPPADKTGTPPTKVLVNPAESDAEAIRRIQNGQASWYGPNFHGRLTANGEKYDMYGMTAAHRTLPFNTLVLVKNLDSGESATVRINDRGPFAKNRIIDLSKEAARKVGMINSGTANVELYVAKKGLKESKSKDLTTPTYTIQLGSFKTEAKAFNHASKIKGSRVEIIRKGSRTVYRVYFGLYVDKEKAYQKQKELERKMFSGFVKQIENG
jgi:rare lipoprotein A